MQSVQTVALNKLRLKHNKKNFFFKGNRNFTNKYRSNF